MTIEIDQTIGIIVGVITIVSTLVATHRWVYKLGLKKADNDFKRISRENRYKLIYAPLRKLLIDKHITTAILVKYPYFKQRLKRAKPDLKKFKLKSAFGKLMDKNVGKRFAEIEFGGNFPLDKMREIVEYNIQWADSKLIGHIQRADRSKYEAHYRNYNKPDYFDQLMTNEELELADHIFDNFYVLNKKITD